MIRRKSAIVAVAVSFVFLLGGCGDDSSPATDDESAQTPESPGADGELTIAVTAAGIDIPDEITGGAVEVTLTSGEDVTFSKVAAGTTEAQFKEAISKTIQGGPIPDFIEAQTGVAVSPAGAKSTVVLPAGEYIVWAAEPEDEDAPEGRVPEIFTKSVTVAAGEGDELPDTGGNVITARDYTFDVELTSGAREFQFRNDGPDQFHHVVLFNFGDLDPAVVEENLLSFLERGEDGPPKPPFDKLNHDELFPGGSAVLSPGQAATATAEIKGGGSTYAAACFITDKKGGAPHAIANGMRTVFTVE